MAERAVSERDGDAGAVIARAPQAPLHEFRYVATRAALHLGEPSGPKVGAAHPGAFVEIADVRGDSAQVRFKRDESLKLWLDVAALSESEVSRLRSRNVFPAQRSEDFVVDRWYNGSVRHVLRMPKRARD